MHVLTHVLLRVHALLLRVHAFLRLVKYPLSLILPTQTKAAARTPRRDKSGRGPLGRIGRIR